ncbi:ABC transporter ATP-binding protein [Aquamicrobium sp. NLF2-7]|uniref:ABC transporter ATP-binding protein n=1 Tax=unclassified Aquamicrobium TaxID=2618194 RepID=UPI001EFA736A|nr:MULTISPECIES: ABC transporter ATP-binding protein [unclassified Aquamicrobium]MCG8272658.1 ABC transporter ATP-binding protein [Aquamicrobium sp. NLF2-7]MCK9551504.1 ABC transporter ATP-binding protein [Aquamicrobium sp.]
MTSTNPAIELKDIRKSYGAAVAIDGVSLTVERGVFLTLLGPSGCGKSTLLRSIGGFVEPDSGKILVDGRDITHEPAFRRPVNMVFQDYALFPHMSVRRNIGFGCEMKNLDRAAIERRCDELLELIRLPQLGERMPDELSGGQRQRVALARALAPDPVSLLLDEPLGALDLKLRQEMQNELKAVQKRTGKTFVFVTHDQEEAMSMSDLVAVMNRGRIEQIASPREIYSRPATAFVAGFIGAANMLDAEVEGVDGDGIVLDIGGSRFRLPSSRLTSGRALRAGDAATVVIRPEQLAAGGRGQEQSLELQGRLEDVTFLGGRAHIRFVTATGQMILAEAPPSMADNVGDTVSFICGSNEMVVLAVDQK